MNEFIKKFVNKYGKKIFSLDYAGNLTIAGNLTLGENGVIKAHMIDAYNNNDVVIIRDPKEMATPYKGGASVVYYLGENAKGDNEEEYINSTWWEKYVLGYDCIIDKTSNADSDFIIYEEKFRVVEDDKYKHNKEILDKYPNTTKIIVSAIWTDAPETHSHWEIKYYDENNTLLFNDVLSSNLLYFEGYYFPFTSLNADDYDEGYDDIVITVEKVHALKEIAKADWSLYMPFTGGTFKGIINTENIAPNIADTYIIGTKDGRYKEGHFKDLYADTFKVSEMYIEDFILDSSKTEIETGDGLIISDNKSDNSIKIANTLKFTGDKHKYLRLDGTFATPTANVIQVEDFTTLEESYGQGVIALYTGNKNSIFNINGVYIGSLEKDNVQINIKGVLYEHVHNTSIIPKSDLNTAFGIILKLDLLGNPAFLSLLEDTGKVTIIYSKALKGWYIKGFKNSGVIPLEESFDEIITLLENIITSNGIYKIESVLDSTVEVNISNFIWRPASSIQFDGTSRNKYLSLAGTFEYIKETDNRIDNILYGSIYKSQYSGIISEGLDNVTKTGLYYISNSNNIIYAQLGINGDSDDGTSFYILTVFNILNTNYGLHGFMPYKLYREGYSDFITGGLKWCDWIMDYENSEYLVLVSNPKIWRALSAKEFKYLLETRKTENTYTYSRAVIDDISGILIFVDNFTKDLAESLLLNFTTSYIEIEDNVQIPACTLTKEEWETIKLYAVFLPDTGYADKDNKYQYPGNEGSLNYWTSDIVKTTRSAYVETFEPHVSGTTKVFCCLCPVRLCTESDSGEFSIGENCKVKIAHGNLQYNPFEQTFRFAKNDYDFVGQNTVNNTGDPMYNGWIDLFAWGASGYKIPPYTLVDLSSVIGSVFDTILDSEDFTEFDWGYHNVMHTIIPKKVESTEYSSLIS